MRDLIITLVVFGAVPFVLMRPYIGIYLWSWLSYMNPHRFSWGFAYNMPFAAVVAVALLIGLFTSKEKNRLPMNAVTMTWVLFVFWITLSTFISLDVDTALIEWQRTLKIQLVTLLTILLIVDQKRLIFLIWVIAGSIGFFGIKGGLFVLATGGSHRVWGPPGTFIEGNNELALALLMISPLFWFLRTQYSNKWVRLALLGAIVLCLLSVISSYSRGAFLAAGAVMFMFWIKSKRKVLYGTGIVLLAVVVLTFMPDKYFDRIGTIQTYEQDGSAMGRINAWLFAFNLARDYPLSGGGFGAFNQNLFLKYAPEPENFHDAHSIYFEVLGEQGFIGLILFLLLWFLCYRTCNKIRKQVAGKKELEWVSGLVSMCQISLVAYCAGGAFLGLAYFDLPYHIFSIVVVAQIILLKLEGSVEKENERLQTVSGRAT